MLNIDHLILLASDCEKSGRFLAEILGSEYRGLNGRGQAEVAINDSFTLIYAPGEVTRPTHLAFHADVDRIFRAKAMLTKLGWQYGSDSKNASNMKDDHSYGGKGFYFNDPNGHKLEIFSMRETVR